MSEPLSETLARLAPGVTPVQHEPMRFSVQSKTRAGHFYVVDMSEYVPNGSCQCDKFLKYGLYSALERGGQIGPSSTCEHIRRVHTFIRIVAVTNFAASLERGNREAVEMMLTPPVEEEAEPTF